MFFKLAVIVLLTGLVCFDGVLTVQQRTVQSAGCNTKGCRRACRMFLTDDKGCRLCRCCYSPGPYCVDGSRRGSLEELIRRSRQPEIQHLVANTK